MAPLPPLQQLGFGTPAGGFKETLHQACAQAEGGIIFFLAAQESAPGTFRTCRPPRLMSAYRGRADMARLSALVCL